MALHYECTGTFHFAHLRLLAEPDYAAGCSADRNGWKDRGLLTSFAQYWGEGNSQSWPYQVLSFIERCT